MQPGGAGGGIVILKAQQIIDLDGTIDVSGSNGKSKSGGGSGGSLTLLTERFIGRGRLLCNGGRASDNAGGGSGGRVTIYCNETRFSGEINAFGGASGAEAGGPGTIYEKTGYGIKTRRTLQINNGGKTPVNNYLVSRRQYENSGKSWILVQSQNDLYYDELRLLGGSHVSFISNISRKVVVDRFVGDDTGMLHVQDGDHILLKSAAIKFPSWFRVYEGGYLALPNIVHLNRLAHRELFVDGALGYVEKFRVGTDVTVVLGNKVNHILNVLNQVQNPLKMFLSLKRD